MSNVGEMICKPLKVLGHTVTPREIASVIDEMADLPHRMVAMDMISGGLMPDATFQEKQEAMNRLCQRWRKLGLMEFSRGRWELHAGAWSKMQNAASAARFAQGTEAGTAETGTGSVYDGAVTKGCAQTPTPHNPAEAV